MIQFTRRAGMPFLKKNQFEAESWANQRVICGIDEVGRGCLAGPLVTAAVILPVHINTRNLKDSKVMTPEERMVVYNWLIKRCWYGIGIVHHRFIDQHNIWQATLLAMKRALNHALAICPLRPEKIVIDAMPLELSDTAYPDIPVHYFPHGERKSSSIAAASIIAKVRRDALMTRLDPVFPQYHFAQHKGYSTALHKNALQNHQHSIIHRMSFVNNLYLPTANNTHEEQMNIV